MSPGSVPSVLVYSAQRFRMVSRRCRSCEEEQFPSSMCCGSRQNPVPMVAIRIRAHTLGCNITKCNAASLTPHQSQAHDVLGA